MRTVRVRVPATTANLGPALDCAGMALNIFNEVLVAESDEDVVVVEGEGSQFLPNDKTNLVYRAIASVSARIGIRTPSLRIECRNNIPLSRGLGSSAAAIVGGIVAANSLLNAELSTQDLLDLAVRMEGHPDNIAPALLGGVVVSCADKRRGVVAARMGVPSDLVAVIAIPEYHLSTEKSRAVLPKSVPYEDAVFNVCRASLLVVALQQGRYDLLKTAMEDRLHQPYRSCLVPGLEQVIEAAIGSGAVGACMSGAGPSVVAFCVGEERKIIRGVGEAMSLAFRDSGVSCSIMVAKPADAGALDNVEH